MSNFQQILEIQNSSPRKTRVLEPEVSAPLTIIDEVSEDDVKQEQTDVIEGEVIENPDETILPIYQRRIPLKWLILFALCIFTITTLVSLYIVPLFFFSASITIVPSEKSLRANLILTLPNAHLLPLQTLSQNKTAATTGKGHQDPTQAKGVVSFFNAAPYSQTVYAGELLVGADGVHIVTDQDAVIPASNAPMEGQVGIPAHAAIAGIEGNILPYDINGVCCKDYVFVKNLSAFSGGMNARDYKIVQKSDIDSVSPSLIKTLDMQIQARFESELKRGDILLAPPSCLSKMTTDHSVGDEASQVTVSVSESCTAISDNKSDFLKAIRQEFLKAEVIRFGPGYMPIGTIQTSTIKVNIKSGHVSLISQSFGSLVYHFTHNEREDIKRLIAGKDKLQAVRILSHFHGIDQVSINIPGYESSLPTNPNRINILVLSRAA